MKSSVIVNLAVTMLVALIISALNNDYYENLVK
jgi:hypothetical protein